MPDEYDLPSLVSASELEVDVEHLGNISTYLTNVAEAVQSIRDNALRQAHRLARVGGEPSEEEMAAVGAAGRSALGSPEIQEVQDLATREQGTFTAVDESLKSIRDTLERTAEGITEIAEQYRTVEERNALTAADWSRVLTG